MYLGYQNGKIKFYTETKLDTALYNIDKVEETQEEYIFDGEEYVLKDEAWEEKQAQKERERLNMLSMTKREMFLGLYQAKGITPDMLKAQITDPQALIEFEYANDYYRGNPLIDVIGSQLGFGSDMLDIFFKTKDYHYLTNITLKINTTPSEAIVTINGKTTKEFSTPYQPNLQLPVTYNVACEGYVTKEEEIVLSENTVLDVVLEKEQPTEPTTEENSVVEESSESV